ncbi:hypothetical protein CBOM_01903 [Ceraceosorus bombacis]|uniref:Uncharacterized protein n=1 Tax=Ceraceosorus bombacis TaxID=401625 RepID=A0A0P1BD51_9BASI|nr:hypothetical protein CBOM_01903 [Ceraceosorus bombacis]
MSTNASTSAKAASSPSHTSAKHTESPSLYGTNGNNDLQRAPSRARKLGHAVRNSISGLYTRYAHQRDASQTFKQMRIQEGQSAQACVQGNDGAVRSDDAAGIANKEALAQVKDGIKARASSSEEGAPSASTSAAALQSRPAASIAASREPAIVHPPDP